MDHGANVEARGWGWWNDGKTPAELALEKGHDDVATIIDRHEQPVPKP